MNITINVKHKLTNRDEIDYEKMTGGEELHLFKIMYEGLFIRDENGALAPDRDKFLMSDAGEPLKDDEDNNIPNPNYGMPKRRRHPSVGKIIPLLYIYARKDNDRLTYDQFLDLPREEVQEACYKLGEHVMSLLVEFQENTKETTEALKAKGHINE